MKVSVPLPTAAEGGCWGERRVSSTPTRVTRTGGGTRPPPITHCSGFVGVKSQNPDSSKGWTAGDSAATDPQPSWINLWQVLVVYLPKILSHCKCRT